MSLAEARTLFKQPAASRSSPGSAPLFVRHDPAADRAALQRLARSSQRFSPIVGIDDTSPSDTLLFDIRGCAHLFGGEQPLARRVLRAFAQQRFVVRMGLADTVGAAWAVAHYATSPSHGDSRSERPEEQGAGTSRSGAVCFVPPGQQKQALAPLPVEGLRLDPQVAAILHRLDIRSIGQLEQLPRSTLPSRFGPGLVERLDQAWGSVPELITPQRLPEPPTGSWSFEYPTADRRPLQRAFNHLTEHILALLRPQERGVLQLDGRLVCRNREQIAFRVGLVHPSTSAAHLGELIGVQLERLTLPGEVATIGLQATSVGPLLSRQQTLHRPAGDRPLLPAGTPLALFAGNARGELEATAGEPLGAAAAPTGEGFEVHAGELAVLLDRLSSRLGRRAVLRPRLGDDFQPEYVSIHEPMLPGATGAKTETQPSGKRRNRRTTTLSPEKGTKPEGPSRQQPGTAAEQLPSPRVRDPGRPLLLSRNPPVVRVISVVPNGPPVRLQGARLDEKIVRVWGPERIETGWWRHPQIARDYYRVETHSGRHFWIYRDTRDGQWYLHGTFE